MDVYKGLTALHEAMMTVDRQDDYFSGRSTDENKSLG